jgi:hypothetical protein
MAQTTGRSSAGILGITVFFAAAFVILLASRGALAQTERRTGRKTEAWEREAFVRYPVRGTETDGRIVCRWVRFSP